MALATLRAEGESMAIRDAWLEKRLAAAGTNGNRNVSQMHYARQGVITEEMEYVAQREKLAPELVRSESGARPRHHSR